MTWLILMTLKVVLHTSKASTRRDTNTLQTILILICLFNTLGFVFHTLYCQQDTGAISFSFFFFCARINSSNSVFFLFIWMFDCQREDELRVGHDLMLSVVFLGGERRERLQRRPGTLLFLFFWGQILMILDYNSLANISIGSILTKGKWKCVLCFII